MLIAYAIGSWIFVAVTLFVAGLCIWAFLDCVRRPAANFQSMGKLTKKAWVAITGVAAVVTFFSFWFAFQAVWAFGGSAGVGIFTLAAAVAAGVYLADVRPAVSGKGSSWS
ncbi:DUF2516 family protein [Galactobacter caseinivorans]|uniref:DUF2516 family protein n=1 Tax=Galactobacter caseinivorans TaxID=2676123 RepID=A0A496PH79_9MICC|nr:DUF2516 family protein [Galactobacter caseinivorans]RKW69820.1 DUF2516 family protein [Galactobacter caseinivorans]